MRSATLRTTTSEPLGIESVRQFTLDEYHHLIEIGFFTSDDKIELINGLLVNKMSQNDPHCFVVDVLSEIFQGLLPEGLTVRCQLPVIISDDSEPEPDGAIVLGPKRRYAKGRPTHKDVALIIEVAESSLRFDQKVKLPLYARDRILTYWIINLIDFRVEVYTRPIGGKNPTYRQRDDYGPDDRVPVVIAGETVGEIAVKDLLP